MGLSMPKFITERYNQVKETYNTLKDGYQMVKSMWSLAKGLDPSKFSQNQSGEDLLNALKKVDGLPDAYKKILSTVDPELLKKMTQMMYDSFAKKGHDNAGVGEEEKATPGNSDVQDDKLLQEFDPANTTVEINTEAVRKASEAFMGGKNPFGKMFEHMNYKRGPTPHTKPKVLDDPVNETNTSIPTQSWKEKEKESYDDVFAKTREERRSDNETFKSTVNEARRAASQRFSPQDASMSGGPDTNMYKNMGMEEKARLNKGFTPFGFPGSKPNDAENQKDLPPLTKMLGEELNKKFGPGWKKKVPPFVANPDLVSNFPDLGLGLDKESNKNMAVQMSKVIKDLM